MTYVGVKVFIQEKECTLFNSIPTEVFKHRAIDKHML